MGLSDVYLGDQSWEQYIGSCGLLTQFEKAIEAHSHAEPLAGSVHVGLSQVDYQLVLELGLGGLGAAASFDAADLACSIEFGFDKLACGLDELNADFNFLLGDVIWKLELHQETLSNLLHEIRLAEFEREARAYRSRAETAYVNGWYDEALADFLEAEKRNYPDFAVLRSIANICLYHLVNLSKALEYFGKAAKYARPSDTRQSAEAHYFAAVSHAVQQQFNEGLDELDRSGRAESSLVRSPLSKGVSCGAFWRLASRGCQSRRSDQGRPSILRTREGRARV